MLFEKKRSEMEIIGEMLEFARRDIKKTRLMYLTNLCHGHFHRYLGFLLRKEFLGVKNGSSEGCFYFTTEKGTELLSCIHHVVERIQQVHFLFFLFFLQSTLLW